MAILVAESKRRSRRISSSICWRDLRRSLNLWALALFHRAKRSSEEGRWWVGLRIGFGFRTGAEMGNCMGNFSAISFSFFFFFVGEKMGCAAN